MIKKIIAISLLALPLCVMAANKPKRVELWRQHPQLLDLFSSAHSPYHFKAKKPKYLSSKNGKMLVVPQDLDSSHIKHHYALNNKNSSKAISELPPGSLARKIIANRNKELS